VKFCISYQLCSGILYIVHDFNMAKVRRSFSVNEVSGKGTAYTTVRDAARCKTIKA